MVTGNAFDRMDISEDLDLLTGTKGLYNLYARLEASGHYSQQEIGEALGEKPEPVSRSHEKSDSLEKMAGKVAERFLKRIDTALDRFNAAPSREFKKLARDEVHQLKLYRDFMRGFLTEYSRMERNFDYSNSDIEKRAIFFRKLLPLIENGKKRQEETANRQRADAQKLKIVLERTDRLLSEDMSAREQLIYVQSMVMGHLLESDLLAAQARYLSKERFIQSGALHHELIHAVTVADRAHRIVPRAPNTMEQLVSGLREILVSQFGLYERLRNRARISRR